MKMLEVASALTAAGGTCACAGRADCAGAVAGSIRLQGGFPGESVPVKGIDFIAKTSSTISMWKYTPFPVLPIPGIRTSRLVQKDRGGPAAPGPADNTRAIMLCSIVDGLPPFFGTQAWQKLKPVCYNSHLVGA